MPLESAAARQSPSRELAFGADTSLLLEEHADPGERHVKTTSESRQSSKTNNTELDVDNVTALVPFVCVCMCVCVRL